MKNEKFLVFTYDMRSVFNTNTFFRMQRRMHYLTFAWFLRLQHLSMLSSYIALLKRTFISKKVHALKNQRAYEKNLLL